MFVDTAKVMIAAGRGGDGAVSFRHEIYIPKGGPDGGDGGKGGDVVFRASRDSNTLVEFRFQPELKAEDGVRGGKRQAAGRSGKNLVVEVPVGTVVLRDGVVVADLTADGQSAVVARGGDGGFGNAHFKSSTRQTPRIAEVGEPGEAYEAELELKLLADVGLVGLPNAGKSTFLSVVSNATPKVADYPFTTLTPSLGVATVDDYDILIADIPGLIEGASEGRGLGDKFLRHVERTQVLLHLIDVYVDDAGEAYRTIRGELLRYSAELAERPEVVALTKVEGVDKEIVEMQMASVLAVNPEAEVYAVSAAAHDGVLEVLRAIRVKLEKRLSAETAVREDEETASELPVITLEGGERGGKSFGIEARDGVFVVSGAKIEKFARMTDYNNYDSLNRLRDIMKKMGIRGELSSRGAVGDSVVEIAGHRFSLVEQ